MLFAATFFMLITMAQQLLRLRYDHFDHALLNIIHTYMCICRYAYIYIELIAFELAGEDRDRRENPVLSRLKIAFFALHKRG
jgi:hypothetical protein